MEQPDSANAPGDYAERKIIGSHRQFSLEVADPVLLEVGTVEPPVYLDPAGDLIRLRLDAAIARWRLQNSARSLRAVIIDGDDRWHTVPYARLRLGSGVTPAPAWVGDWLVSSVRHRWSAERGYEIHASATLWQGYP